MHQYYLFQRTKVCGGGYMHHITCEEEDTCITITNFSEGERTSSVQCSSIDVDAR